jgi:hypothetical protein
MIKTRLKPIPISYVQKEVFVHNYEFVHTVGGKFLFSPDGCFTYVEFEDEIDVLQPKNYNQN